MVDQERMFGQLCIDGTPPDIRAGTGFVHNTFVPWGTTRFLARGGDKGSGRGDDGAGFVTESIFIQFGHRGVPEHEDMVVIDPRVVVELFGIWVEDVVMSTRVGLARHGGSLFFLLVVGVYVGLMRIGSGVERREYVRIG